MRILLVVGVILFSLVGGCLKFGDRNVPRLKVEAPAFLESHGFKVVAYQGYQYGPICGGKAWYTLEKGGITYEAMVMPWGGELHLYGLEAIDAIKP